MRYDVATTVYEGPLPLLVELTRLNLIDVFIIKLVALTQQYLAQVKQPGQDLNQLSEPLPLLGTLLALKARGLLPAPSTSPEDEDVPISLEELERRLKEYEQFKTVAQLLAELHQLTHKQFTRLPAELPQAAEAPKAPMDVQLTDLVTAFSKVLERSTAPMYEVAAEAWTVEMKLDELRVMLTVRRHVKFFDLFTPEKSRLELVVTFLALLELIRQRLAKAVQDSIFSDIEVVWCANAIEGASAHG